MALNCSRGAVLTFNIRVNVFTEKVVMHWKRLPREAVESSCLEVFKRHRDVALGTLV